MILYHEHERIASHERASERGHWSTVADHLPPEKLEGLLPQPVELKARAERVGPSAAELVERLLGDRPMDRVRSAQAILKLSKRYGPQRLEAACRRALAFNELRYHTIKTILRKGLESESLPEIVNELGPLPKSSTYARPVFEMLSE